MPKTEVEVTYQPVVRYNKYGLSIKKELHYDSDGELSLKIKQLQAKVRQLVMEQIKVDNKKVR